MCVMLGGMFCVMLHVMVWGCDVGNDGVSDVTSALVDVGEVNYLRILVYKCGFIFHQIRVKTCGADYSKKNYLVWK